MTCCVLKKSQPYSSSMLPCSPRQKGHNWKCPRILSRTTLWHWGKKRTVLQTQQNGTWHRAALIQVPSSPPPLNFPVSPSLCLCSPKHSCFNIPRISCSSLNYDCSSVISDFVLFSPCTCFINISGLQELEGLFREVEAVSRKETHYLLQTHSAFVAKAQPKDQPLMVPILQYVQYVSEAPPLSCHLT